MMNYDHWRHYARGWVLHVLGRTDGAYEAYAEAFRIDPRDIQAARHLAAIAAERKRWTIAADWLQKVVALAPNDATAHFNLAFTLDHDGGSEIAIASFERAVALDEKLDRAWYGMGLAMARLGRHADAVAAFEKAVALQPMNGEAYYQLGMALHHSQRPDEVAKVVARLVDFEPKRAKRLVQDAMRPDLMHLIPELPF